jgi:hypothetical protein
MKMRIGRQFRQTDGFMDDRENRRLAMAREYNRPRAVAHAKDAGRGAEGEVLLLDALPQELILVVLCACSCVLDILACACTCKRARLPRGLPCA